jgi:hypothetical protein
VVKGLAQDCDKPCYSGRSVVLIFQVKRRICSPEERIHRSIVRESLY